MAVLDLAAVEATAGVPVVAVEEVPVAAVDPECNFQVPKAQEVFEADGDSPHFKEITSEE